MKRKILKLKNSKSGFVILFAVVFSSILLAVGLGVANVALKEINFSTSAKSSNDSFLAADNGVECALMNDKMTTSAFTATSTGVNCLGSSIIPFTQTSVIIGNPIWSWSFVLPPGSTGVGQNYCSRVTVQKDSSNSSYTRTTITSQGYNLGDSLCNPTTTNRIERELVVTYGGIPDNVWVEDDTPTGATLASYNEGWNWVTTNPSPFSGTRAHQSDNFIGLHQHYFYNASSTLSVNEDDTMFAYVYINPSSVPQEIMLQWNVGGSWEHRAYWGTEKTNWGSPGTAAMRYQGALPPTGQWVRLNVPAEDVGLEGQVVNGMAFTLFDGQATWDRAGKSP